MKDHIIGFETAKLAKEKGFTGLFNTVEYIPMYNNDDSDEERYGKLREYQGEDEINCPIYLLAVSQSLLQKWLREKHNIIVTIRPHFYNMNPPYKIKYEYVIFVHSDGREFDTYEGCLEIALQEALNSIKI